MQILLILAVAIPVAAQIPVVQRINTTRPDSTEFQIGDRFEIVIIGRANQPVSVRTTRNGRMDWGAVIGRTDPHGRWSTTGQFEKSDFGDWSEVWTVRGKLANPAMHFSVNAPCLIEGQRFAEQIGLNVVLTCETAAGRETFRTSSGTEPFRTSDGRVVPGRMRSNMTAEQYRIEIMQSLISSPASVAGWREFRDLGDKAADLITEMLGDNALTEDETRNVLSIIRVAFEKPDNIRQAAKYPSVTLRLLGSLTNATGQESLKQQIAETMAYVQAQTAAVPMVHKG